MLHTNIVYSFNSFTLCPLHFQVFTLTMSDSTIYTLTDRLTLYLLLERCYILHSTYTLGWFFEQTSTFFTLYISYRLHSTMYVCYIPHFTLHTLTVFNCYILNFSLYTVLHSTVLLFYILRLSLQFIYSTFIHSTLHS